MQVFVHTPNGSQTTCVDVLGSTTIEDVVLAVAPYPGANSFRVVYRGRTIQSKETIQSAGIPCGSILCVCPRLLGGGGDGGSTGAESRSAYLAMYAEKKPDKVDPNEQRLAKWTTCHLSGQQLRPPCVIDRLGNLYNKEEVLQALLAKTMPPSLWYISSLKHVIDLVLEASPDASSFVCPVTGTLMNGKSKFVAVRRKEKSKAYAMSEKALRELPEVVTETLGGAWDAGLNIPLYPTGEQLEKLQSSLQLMHTSCPSIKKRSGGEKRKRKHDTVAAPAGADPQVWNSIFLKKASEDLGNNDFMVRGQMKYIS